MSINSIYAPESKYGYRININHPKIQPFYEAYKRKKRAMILSDEERVDFENKLLAWLEKQKGENKSVSQG